MDITIKILNSSKLFNLNDFKHIAWKLISQYASELCQWLWSKLLRKELADFVDLRNSSLVRKQKFKKGPFSKTAMSRNEAFSMPETWGGRNCLLKLSPEQLDIVREIKAAMGGDELLEFNSRGFREKAIAIYDSLNIVDLNFTNVWHIFRAMYVKMYA